MYVSCSSILKKLLNYIQIHTYRSLVSRLTQTKPTCHQKTFSGLCTKHTIENKSFKSLHCSKNKKRIEILDAQHARWHYAVPYFNMFATKRHICVTQRFRFESPAQWVFFQPVVANVLNNIIFISKNK